MEQLVLKQEIIDVIKTDVLLQAKVALALGISHQTIYLALRRHNNLKLTQAGVLKVIREHLNIKKDSELITEIAHA